MMSLHKYRMSYQFDPSQHPRGDHGRFSGSGGGSDGAPSFRQTTLAEASPGPARRSLTRGEVWQRVGAKLPELPTAYTGSKEREQPVDGWKELSVKVQAPKAMKPEEHIAHLKRLKQIVAQEREGAIEKAKVTRQKVAVHGIKDFYTLKRRTGDLTLDPATPRGAVNRAYNHAAMLALHDAGVVDYNFKMSDDQKKELTPLIPFMRYARNRLKDKMKGGDLSVARSLHISEFGQPFKNPKMRRDGSGERLRLRPNQELVKLRPFGELLDRLQARRDPDGIEARKAAIAAAASRADPKPSNAQKEAGNYRMGHVRIGGLGVTIENAKDSIREKIGKNGKGWRVKMPAHYGYVKGSIGADGDHVDVYLGPHAHIAHTLPVHVVNQVFTGTNVPDEHKALLGFPSRREAIRTYDAGFSDGKGPQRRRSVDTMPFPAFRAWVKSKEPAMAKRAPPGVMDARVIPAIAHADHILRRVGGRTGRGVASPLVAAVVQRDMKPTLGVTPSESPQKRMARNERARDPRRSLADLHRAA